MRYLRPRELERTDDSMWAWVGSFGEGLRKQGGILLYGILSESGDSSVAVHLSTFYP